MKIPPLSASLLARQTPAVRALLAKAQRRDPPVRTEVTRDGDVLVMTLPPNQPGAPRLGSVRWVWDQATDE